MENKDKVLIRDLLQSWLTMIERDGNEHPSAVLSDIKASIQYVLGNQEV